MTVLFRVDAGDGSGLGHLSRCLALAAALGETGLRSAFLVPDHADLLARVRARGFEALGFAPAALGTPADLKGTAETALRLGCRTVVVDSYHVDESFFQALQATGAAVVAIDDLARHAFPCRLVVNGGAAAERLPYRGSAGDTQFLLGPRYALLRPEFWDGAARPAREAVESILLTVGGSDPHDLLPPLLELLDALPGSFAITAVVGPFSLQAARAKQVARSAQRQVTIVHAPDSLCELMLQADLAVSAAGQTLYELVRLGVPAVAFGLVENQRPNLEALAAAGAIRAAGWASEPGFAAGVVGAAAGLSADAGARRSLAQAAVALLDGQGARRVAAAIAAQ